MGRVANRQYRSVGNLGDVLKHAVLVALAEKLAPARYIDTHAFLLQAPPADLPQWNMDVARLVAHPAYERYVTMERASLERTGHYRCSSGLMVDVLGEQARLALGETNAVTRAELKQQIATEQHRNVEVVEDAVAALRLGGSDAGRLLIHIDPFALTSELWASLAPPLDAICQSTAEVAMVVYRYTRSAPSPWPTAPRGTTGPVAQTRGGPHELAAYASPSLGKSVQEVCASLGWRIAD